MFNPKEWLVRLLGKHYFSLFPSGKKFAKNVSKYLLPSLYDGSYSDIVVGTKEQVAAFIAVLQLMENQGDILFGSFITHSAIIKCFVKTMNGQHVFFLDGAEGGYTTAAKVLKPKISTEMTSDTIQ